MPDWLISKQDDIGIDRHPLIVWRGAPFPMISIGIGMRRLVWQHWARELYWQTITPVGLVTGRKLLRVGSALAALRK